MPKKPSMHHAENKYLLYSAAALVIVLVGYVAFTYLNLSTMRDMVAEQKIVMEESASNTSRFAQQAAIYEDMVQEYNEELHKFPASLVAQAFGFKKIDQEAR